jgi:XapX domain-containing protein
VVFRCENSTARGALKSLGAIRFILSLIQCILNEWGEIENPRLAVQAGSERGGTEFSMNAFVVSLAMGAVVGIVYGLSGVRSPAPPIIALVGLLGMVLGEHAVTLAKAHFSHHAEDQNDRSIDRDDP